jgi:hypothetical protein
MLSFRLWLLAHPILVMIVKMTLLVVAIVYAYTLLPVQNRVMLGINAPYQFSEYLGNYLRFSYQAKENKNNVIEPKTTYGFIRGIQKDSLVVEYAQNGEFVIAKWALGNIELIKSVDLDFLKDYQTSSFKFDLYPLDKEQYAVIAYDQNGGIFNLSLIEYGYAIPIDNPKTKVIDYVFSQYYLKKLKEMF